MDKFETQFEDLDVATGYYENATSSATATGTPQEDVDRLMNQVADEAGVEMAQEAPSAKERQSPDHLGLDKSATAQRPGSWRYIRRLPVDRLD